VERLYLEAKLQVRRHKRKKVAFGERQPLLPPTAANQLVDEFRVRPQTVIHNAAFYLSVLARLPLAETVSLIEVVTWTK
jgi:hypothetical protein